MSTDVPLVPPSPFRPPLTLLVLLHAIFQALRGILESGTNPVMVMAVGELLHAGYLPAARAALDAHAARALAHPTGPLPREVARYRALREECDVTVQRRGQFVCVRATLGDAPKPTRLTDGGGHEAMRKAGFDSAPLYDGAPWVGQRAGYLSRDDAEQAARDGSPLVEALRGLGFASVTVLPPVDANDEDARDFRFEDDASDHEGALA